jgi:hydrogenase maturation protease
MTNPVLVLGLGSRLLGDDAAGPLTIDSLAARVRDPAGEAPARSIVLQDGGTIGLGLLPAIEDASALIAVDAARFGAPAGTVRVFEGEALERLLGGRKSSAHEVTLADLVGAAALRGTLPAQCALVAVEPACTQPGLAPSAAVAAAIPRLCEAVHGVLRRWSE